MDEIRGLYGRCHMYHVIKRFEVSASHHLCLPYESKCLGLHGHNWIITVYCQSDTLTEYGMVVDFTEIKRNISDVLDHQNLNEILDFNPTAENIAKWVCDRIPGCYRVDVQESENNTAIYERDNDSCSVSV